MFEESELPEAGPLVVLVEEEPEGRTSKPRSGATVALIGAESEIAAPHLAPPVGSPSLAIGAITGSGPGSGNSTSLPSTVAQPFPLLASNMFGR